MRRLVRTISAVRQLGWFWGFERLRYWILLRLRWFEWKCPARRWESIQIPEEGVPLEERRFCFRASVFSSWSPCWPEWDQGPARPVEATASAITAGRYLFFGWDERDLGEFPDWHRNPYSGERVPSTVHWSRLSDFGYGDIKNVWELSRFGWVFPLVRAFARDGDTVHQTRFRSLLLDWLTKNPPNLGPQWKCGQEVAIRLNAVLWGWFGLGGSDALRDLVRKLAWVSGKRIEANIGYALRQNNNHGLSEAMGLWTVGLLFPEFAESARWKRLGRRLLEEQAGTLIYADGGCSQSSFNYQRLMLDVLMWSARLGQIYEEPLGSAVMDAIEVAAGLLWRCQDEATGRLPNYGANDGALLLPLTGADYSDFRPALQAATMLVHGRRRFAGGIHDEAVLWLFGREHLKAPLMPGARGDLRAESSGYYTLRNRWGFLFMRCGSYRHRPAHADQLHVDVWWRGENVVRDSGTYSYNAAKPFEESFKGTRFHNTVVVDDLDQMESVNRFLWASWVKGSLIDRGEDYLVGRHDGYQRLAHPATHARKVVRLWDQGFLVLDRIHAQGGSHSYAIHWQLPEGFEREGTHAARVEAGREVFEVQLLTDGSTPLEASWTPSGRERAEAWSSRYYMQKEAGYTLSGRTSGEEALIGTWLGSAAVALAFTGDGGGVRVETDEGTKVVTTDF